MVHITGPGLLTLKQAARQLVDRAKALESGGYTVSYEDLIALESAVDTAEETEELRSQIKV